LLFGPGCVNGPPSTQPSTISQEQQVYNDIVAAEPFAAIALTDAHTLGLITASQYATGVAAESAFSQDAATLQTAITGGTITSAEVASTLNADLLAIIQIAQNAPAADAAKAKLKPKAATRPTSNVDFRRQLFWPYGRAA
jgi:hypothetical protein